MFNDGILGVIISKEEKSHDIITKAINYIKLKNYKHIGIMLDIPFEFYANSGFIDLNKKYAILNIKKSDSEPKNEYYLETVEEMLSIFFLKISNIRETQSLIQLAIEKPYNMLINEFEKTIYKARIALINKLDSILSFSLKTIIYKDIDIINSDLADYSYKSNFIIYELSNNELTLDSCLSYLGYITTYNSNKLDIMSKYGQIFNTNNILSDTIDYLYYNKQMDYDSSILALCSSNLDNDYNAFYNRIFTLFEGPLYSISSNGDSISIHKSIDNEFDVYIGMDNDFIYVLNDNLCVYNLSNFKIIDEYYTYDLINKKSLNINDIIDKSTIKANNVFNLSNSQIPYEAKFELNEELIDICKDNNSIICELNGFYPSIRKCKLDLYYTNRSQSNSLYIKSVILSNGEFNNILEISKLGFRSVCINSNYHELINKAYKDEIDFVIVDDNAVKEEASLINKCSKSMCFILNTDKYDFASICYYLSIGISLIYPSKAYSNILGFVEKKILDNDGLLSYVRYIKNNLSRVINSYGIHNIRGFISSNLYEKKETFTYSKVDLSNLGVALKLNDYKKYRLFSKNLKNSFNYKNGISLDRISNKEELYSYFRCVLNTSESVKKCLNKAFNQDIQVIDKRFNDIDFSKSEFLIDFSDYSRNIERTDYVMFKRHNIIPSPLFGLKANYDLYSISDLSSLVESIKEVNPNAFVIVKINNYDNILDVISSNVDEVVVESMDKLIEINNLLISLNLRDNILLSLEYNYRNAYDVVLASMNGSNRFYFGKSILAPLGCMSYNKCYKCPFGLFNDKEFNGDINNLFKYVDFLVKEIIDVESMIGYTLFNKNYNRRSFINNINKQIKSLIDSNQTNINIMINGENSIGANLCNYNKSITLQVNGNASNQLGYYLNNNKTIILNGSANKYLAECLNGGNIYVKNSHDYITNDSTFLVGSGALYKANSGVLYVDGIVGSRFAMANNGAIAVTLGMLDYGCSFMSNGCVVSLGDIGPNFGFNMTGGIAYLYTLNSNYMDNIDKRFVEVAKLDSYDTIFLVNTLEDFINKTDSKRGKQLFRYVDPSLFVKVVPKNYLAVKSKIAGYQKEGLSLDEAVIKVVGL